MRQGPFQKGDITPDQLQERIEQLQGAATAEAEMQPIPEDQPDQPEKKKG
jgi:hypothetical protein